MQVVLLIEDLAADFWIELAKTADLGILLRDQPLIHSGDLDEHPLIRQIEVGREVLSGPAISTPGDGERSRFINPGQSVKVE